MAHVVSGNDLTVIVLNNDEASALADLLFHHMDSALLLTHGFALDELTNAMLSGSCEEGEEGTEIAITPYDAPEPPWKDEPTTDYRVHD